MGMYVADAAGHLPGQFNDTSLFAGDLQAPVLAANVTTPVAASLLLLYIRGRITVLSLTYSKSNGKYTHLIKAQTLCSIGYSGATTHIDPTSGCR
jgi:hypothetical protein